MAHIEHLTSWLNDAYAMEQSLIQVLENHAHDAKDHPPMQQRIQRHIAETKTHAERVEQCLQTLDEKPSMMKSGAAKLSGMAQGASTGLARDELVKNVLSDYAAEHMEIASYRSLIAAAEELAQPRIAELCRANLREEEAMARWLEEQIDGATRAFLQETLAEHR